MRGVNFLSVSAIALLLAACSVQSQSGGTAPQASTGTFGIKQDALTVDTPKAFKEVKQVVIGSFEVAFIEGKKDSAKAGGGLLGGSFGGRSSAKMSLSGLTPDMMQRLTDKAYADFVADLKAKGYVVVDRSALEVDETFKTSSTQPSPKRSEASFFGSNNTLTYVAPKAIGALYFAGGQGGFGNHPAGNAVHYAEKNNVRVLFVDYTVDFANAEGSGGWARSSSSMRVGQGISVKPGGGVSLIGGQGGTFSTNNGSIKLGQPVYSDEEFGTIADTTDGVSKGVETATNVASALLGGGTNITRDFAVKADPEKYEKIAANVLGDANDSLVAKMAALQ